MIKNDIVKLSQRKCMYEADYSRNKFNTLVSKLPTPDAVHIYCDDFVSGAGTAGCDAIVPTHCSHSSVSEQQYSLRLSDHSSFTRAELQVVHLGFINSLSPIDTDTYNLLDSSSVMQVLTSRNNTHTTLASVCRGHHHHHHHQ